MPVELLKRIDLDQLYFPFCEKVLELVANCRARGADYFAISGYRTNAQQDELYRQGREDPGKVVTNARAGQSAHNFGLAVDFCRDAHVDRKGLQPDWDAASYAILGEEARKLGLVWAGNWVHFKETPHVQWPGYVTAKDLETLKALKAREGLSAVFDFLDAEARRRSA